MLNQQNSHHLVNAFRFLKLDAGAVTCTSTQIQMEEEMLKLRCKYQLPECHAPNSDVFSHRYSFQITLVQISSHYDNISSHVMLDSQMCSRCAHSRMWFVAPGRASPPNLGPILANLRQVAKVRRNLARTDGVRVGCQGERGTSADSLSKQALAPTSPTSRQCTQSWKGWLYLTGYCSHNMSTRHY